MGTLPVATVVGSFYATYEAYYQQVDPNSEGRVGAAVAARFLKTSGLSDDILSKVWDLADANGKGYLTKSEFFVALKLVALVQAGKEAIAANLPLDVPPPRMLDTTSTRVAATIAGTVPTDSTCVTASLSDWAMKPEEKSKYDRLFDSLNSSNGFVSGNDVKGLLMDSKLPVDTLGRIWDLADMDKDGALDRHEFSVAMHLVYKALEKYAIPSYLPVELQPSTTAVAAVTTTTTTTNKVGTTQLVGAVPVLPALRNGIPAPATKTTILPPSALPIVATTVPSSQAIPHATLVEARPTTNTAAYSSSSSRVSVMSPVNAISPVAAVAPSLISSPSCVTPPLAASPLISSGTSTAAAGATTITPTPLLCSLSNTTTALQKARTASLSSTTHSPADSTAVTFPTNCLLASRYEDSCGWVISAEEKAKFDALFEQADLDKDGFVSGHEIKDTFLKSGVAQPVLAHIWNLCDTEERGKLDKDQFALALWLISRQLKGIDPPARLSREMVPPSCRKSSVPNDALSSSSSNDAIVVVAAAATAAGTTATAFNSPEVDRLTAEIDHLAKEKSILETNITQREADIRIKSSELKSLQNELDALVATLKQLENQKGEALKRINDLKTQVNKLRQQAEEQERQLKSQETELNKRKEELKNIEAEEANLKRERDVLWKRTDDVTKSSADSVQIINEIRARMTELKDFRTQLNAAVSHLDSVLESKNVARLSEVLSNVEPKFENESSAVASLCERASKLTNSVAAATAAVDCSVVDVDPFSNTSTRHRMSSVEKVTANFSSTTGCAANIDPFAQHDPFISRHQLNVDRTNNVATGFGVDAIAFVGVAPVKAHQFSGADHTATVASKADSSSSPPPPPLSLFQQRQGDVAGNELHDAAADADPFGCDPFAVLHAPPKSSGNSSSSPSLSSAPMPTAPRSESPSPALPPKKCKQPPPRPAPPRPAPPAVPSGFETDFADFSNFSRKVIGDTVAAVVASTPAPAPTPASACFGSNNVSVPGRDGFVFKSTSKMDPFRDYRYDDPFEMADRYGNIVNHDNHIDDHDDDNLDAAAVEIPRGASAPPLVDAFEACLLKSSSGVRSASASSSMSLTKSVNGSGGDGGLVTKSVSSSEIGWPSEDQQVAWATTDSVKVEKERRKRAEHREKADFKLAVKLSKAEGKKKSGFRSKILL